MPWSDWQTGETGTFNWTDVGRGFRNIGWQFNGDWQMFTRSDPNGPGAAISTEALESTTEELNGRVYEQTSGAFLTLPNSWKQIRRGIPSALSALEFGKDWDQIPDRPGEFVEYEPGDNVALSTRGPSINFVSGSPGGGSGALSDGDGAWSLGVVTNAPAPPYTVVGSGDYIPNGQWPGLGSVFATGTYAVAPGTNYRSSFPDVTGATDIFVSARMTGAIPVGGGAESARFNISVPQLTYQMPRWRYWIPGTPPLRLRQRDDDLFMNTGHLRQRSSRQSTNRLRAYD